MNWKDILKNEDVHYLRLCDECENKVVEQKDTTTCNACLGKVSNRGD